MPTTAVQDRRGRGKQGEGGHVVRGEAYREPERRKIAAKKISSNVGMQKERYFYLILATTVSCSNFLDVSTHPTSDISELEQHRTLHIAVDSPWFGVPSKCFVTFPRLHGRRPRVAFQILKSEEGRFVVAKLVVSWNNPSCGY